MSDWPDNDPTFTEKPRLWHVQYADESRDCDGTYPLTEHYVWARCEDDAHNRAHEDFDTSEGVPITGQHDTRPATDAEVRAWLNERAAEVGGDNTEYGLRDDKTGHVLNWGRVNYMADEKNYPGYTLTSRTVGDWQPVTTKEDS